ncbi:PAS domain S-box protein [Allosphingosinicella flava]|uniref:histidine kinase n=1 Tax=Allosphingosinicella flava TaxID=2771430 RepID=A0A7T2LLB7_9SPHN|nr:PAS domain S-box protein [Sphingosinicella flava]QPQ54264.1 PAS domain S-box protein [Sphingosinicella flava]
MQRLLDALPVGLVYAAASGRILGGNRKAEEIFGHPILPTEAIEEHGNWVAYHADGRRVEAEDYPLVRVLKGALEAELDVHYERKDGGRNWIRLTASQIRDDHGHIVGGLVVVRDIDAERKAMEEARTANERLRVAQRAGGIGTYEILPEQGRILVSEEFCKVWGLDPTDEITVAQAENMLHPDDLASVRQDGDYGVGRAAYRVIHPLTGEKRWIVRRGEAVTVEDGKVRHFGVTYDITETKRTEEALRDREERLRAALEGSGAGTFRWDLRTGALEFDATLNRLFGFPEEEGPTTIEECAARIHLDDRDAFIAACETSIATGADFDMEYRVVRPDGKERWLHDRAKVYFGDDGKAAYMTGACIDLTDRIVIARRLNTVLESISDCFIAVDAKWTISLLNKASEEYFGFKREEALGRNIWEVMPYIHGTELEQALHRVMETRKPERLEMASNHRPGTSIELRFSPKQGGGVACTFSDVTERKKAERHKEILLGELNHRVKNTMTLVQATARQTFKRGEVPEAVQRTFEGRLSALAAAHDVLTRQSWESAMLGEIVTAALAPFGALEEGRVTVEGPAVQLPPQATVIFAMALHELATNAAKYGALSNDEGRISITWAREEGDGNARLTFTWKENGGPKVSLPEGRGFGSRLIESVLAAELGGTVRLHFAADGLCCLIDAPLSDG